MFNTLELIGKLMQNLKQVIAITTATKTAITNESKGITLGHSKVHGGLRGHSLGNLYPLGIYKQGFVYKLANLITGQSVAKSWDYDELEAIALGNKVACDPIQFKAYNDGLNEGLIVIIPEPLRKVMYGAASLLLSEVQVVMQALQEEAQAYREECALSNLPMLIDIAKAQSFLQLVQEAIQGQ